MRGLTPLDLLILALVIAIPVVPFDCNTVDRLTLAELIATGAADVCWQHFRIETNDNLLASKHVILVRVLMRTTDVLVVIVTAGTALMTFDQARQYGVSLFASARVAGIDGRLAARPVLSNSWRNHFKSERRKHP